MHYFLSHVPIASDHVQSQNLKHGAYLAPLAVQEPPQLRVAGPLAVAVCPVQSHVQLQLQLLQVRLQVKLQA